MRHEMNKIKDKMTKNATENRNKTSQEIQNLAVRMNEIEEQFRNNNSNNPVPPPLNFGRNENSPDLNVQLCETDMSNSETPGSRD